MGSIPTARIFSYGNKMSEETIDISCMNLKGSLLGVEDIQKHLHACIKKSLVNPKALLLAGETTLSVSPAVIDMYHGFCFERQLQGQIGLSVLEIDAFVGYLRSFIPNELDVTDVPVSHAIMLPLKIARLIDGTISVAEFIYEECPEILEYLENAG